VTKAGLTVFPLISISDIICQRYWFRNG